jgi:uncharacterized protein
MPVPRDSEPRPALDLALALGLPALCAGLLSLTSPWFAGLGRTEAAALGIALCVGLPALLARAAMGRASIPLWRPSPRALLGAALVGVGMPSVSYVVYIVTAVLTGRPEGAIGGLSTAFLDAALREPYLAVLGLALVPAACEEILFRGVVLGRLAPVLGKGWAVVLSAILFAVAHLDLPAAPSRLLLGLVLGFAVLRSGSLLPAVVLHAVNNAVALALAAFVAPSVVGIGSVPSLAEADVWAEMALGVLAAGGGLALLARPGTELRDADRERPQRGGQGS